MAARRPVPGELSNPQTLGRYGYVGNNPVTATDAYGYAITVKIKGEPNIPRKPRIAIGPTTTWAPQAPGTTPSKPDPTAPVDASNTTATHDAAWQALVRLGGAMFLENLRGQVNLLASVGNALINDPVLLGTMLTGIGMIIAGALGTGGGAAASVTGVGTAPGVALSAGSIALIGTGIAAVGVAAAGAAVAVANDGGIEIWKRSDGSISSRDIHGELRKSERDVDVNEVVEKGDLYYQDDGRLVRVLSNGMIRTGWWFETHRIRAASQSPSSSG